MAIYYSAYLAKRKPDNHYEIIGPFVYDKNGELRCECIWWRSQSFIHWNDFEAWHLSADQFDGELTKKKMIEDFGFEEDKEYSLGWWLSAKEIYARGSGEPIRGFLPVEEAKGLIESGYDMDYIDYEMYSKPVGAEFVAGMTDAERNKYTFVSYIDYQSAKYHLWEIGRILNGFEDYVLVDKDKGEEFGVLFQVG